MTMRVRTMIAALSLASWTLPALGDDRPKVTTEDDLVYTKVGDTELKIDLARPSEGDGPFPAVPGDPRRRLARG